MPLNKRVKRSKKTANIFRQIEQILTQNDDEQIYEDLRALHKRYPTEVAILEVLVDYAYDLEDQHNYLIFLYRFTELEPKRTDLWYALGTALFPAGYPFLASAYMKRGLELAGPHATDEDTVKVRENIERIEPLLEELLVSMELNEVEDQYRVAADHDLVRFLLEHGEIAKARTKVNVYLKQFPATVPLLNNLSYIEFLERKYPEAIARAQQVLALEPQNVHALSNLVHFYLLSGDPQQAHEIGRQLANAPIQRVEHLLKKAEAFSYLGDDEAVLAVYRESKTIPKWDVGTLPPLFLHLTATAFARQGNTKEAKRLWQQALKSDSDREVISANLEDLARPAHERNGPWAFPLPKWLNKNLLQDLTDVLMKAQRLNHEKGQQLVQKFLSDHPEVETLSSIIMERGDESSRKFYLEMFDLFNSPQIIEALKAFAMGQAGSDDMRTKVAHHLHDAGHLDGGPHRMWMRGHWNDISLTTLEIYTEPVEDKTIPPAVHDILAEGVEALHKKDYEKAKDCLLKANRLAPDSPTVLNNLALAYERLGDQLQARMLTRQLEERFPDYFFGVLTRANRLTHGENPDEAIELLNQLYKRSRFHISEYVGLCTAMIQAWFKKGKPEGAKAWLKAWKDVDPDNPAIEEWEMRIDPKPADLFKLFSKRLGR
jgi:tetratricopeptide (TPR) repeat protein